MSSWRQIASQGLRARMTATLRAVQAAMGPARWADEFGRLTEAVRGKLAAQHGL